MEKKVNVKAVNELLKELGHNNLIITNCPNFLWNGNTITEDETAPIKIVSTYGISKERSFQDFLEENKDKKIVLLLTSEGMFQESGNLCTIRSFVS